MKPPKSILSRAFRYTCAAETDVGKTFAKARKKLKEEAEQRARDEAEAKAKVSPIKQPKSHTV